MKCRLIILTEIIAPYRIPVFNVLAQREDIDPHVVFLSETDAGMREWRVYKEEIRFSYEVLPSFRRRLGRYNLLLNRSVGATLRAARPDVILCGGYNYLASWSAARWSRRHDVPFLLWVESNAHDQRGGHAVVEWLKRKFLEGCDAFVVPGISSRDYLKSFGIPEEIIFTAPDAVDNDFFLQRSARARGEDGNHRNLPARFFLYVGRLVPEKGVFDLLQAYATLEPKLRSEMALVFVGSGVAEKELRARAAGIHPGQVQFAGFVHKEELADYYALSDMMVFPTHTDPWGLVVNEAMACGLPVICTNVAGCSADLVNEGWNGRIVPPCNVARLASAMDDLARDPELRARMGNHSQERISAFSPEACAQGLASAALAAGSCPRG